MENMYNELHDKLSKLQWLLHRHHLHSHAAFGPSGDPSRGQGRVLAVLKMQEEITTKDLSYVLGIRQQSLNELLNKLEKQEYVTRTPLESDKRILMVRLTEKGRSEQRNEPDYSQLFGGLDLEEQKLFGEYLDRVIASLEAKVGNESSDWDDEDFRAKHAHLRHAKEMHHMHGQKFGRGLERGHHHGSHCEDDRRN